MTSVTVLCPNARRCAVKVTPGMLLKQILEEACLKQGFDVEAYQLENQKRRVDLALPFRLSGLPNNATLEMVPKADTGTNAVAAIALQIPERPRIELSFPITESLFSVLKGFSPLFEEDLTAPREDCVPCCFYMNRQYMGEQELRRITLSSIGITSGRSLIRYQRLPLTEEQKAEIAARLADDVAKKQEMLSKFIEKKAENENRAQLEANRLARFEEELKLEREKNERARKEAPANAQTIPVNESFDAPVFSTREPETVSSDRLASLNRLLQQVDTSLISSHEQQSDRITNILADGGRVPLSRIAAEAVPMEEEDVSTAVSSLSSVAPCDRQTVIFHRHQRLLRSAEAGADETELSEEFFDIGLEDLRSRQKELHDEVRMHTQRMLIPKVYENRRNREAKLNAYRHTVVRIPVGKERIIQGQFYSGEPVSRLYQWVRSLLSRNVSFSLNFVLNEKIEETDMKNFVDLDIAPKSTLYLKFKDGNVNVESIFDIRISIDGSLMQCTQEEANKLSADWLSQNSTFVPFTGVILENDRNGKRPATNHPQSSDFVPPPQKAGPAPKWLKRK
ncbi:hypothetical protein ANCDUO_22519 [Ancylostoma duodenale]|uniref:TUG ubiquitin-like domain-containing protein n=1 Tax=Ancylostoma duodenale TaxID=51022 RepID=A0A0C2FR95_9BILA|nr:hypothetical protein ANCDUO_22519 [Ancylostoma duodenale]